MKRKIGMLFAASTLTGCAMTPLSLPITSSNFDSVQSVSTGVVVKTFPAKVAVSNRIAAAVGEKTAGTDVIVKTTNGPIVSVLVRGTCAVHAGETVAVIGSGSHVKVERIYYSGAAKNKISWPSAATASTSIK